MRTAILAPSIQVLRASTRLKTETSWLDSRHCFSFGHYYEPGNSNHGLLVVCNDNRVLGSTGFGWRTHEDMEILTWMVEGQLEYRDDAGTHVLCPGLVRRISAGRGLRHWEGNPAAWEVCRYIEMWVLPEAAGLEPGVEVADVSRLLAANGLVRVATGAGPSGPITLGQPGAVLWAGRLGPDEPVEVPDGPHVHLFVAVGGGVLDTGGLAGAGHLSEGDSARLVAAGTPVFTAGPSGAELLVWQTA